MSLSEAQLLDDVQRLFAPSRSAMPRAVGVELELIPILKATREPALTGRENVPSTAEVLSRLGERERWIEKPADGDPPSWALEDGGRISFEPGGQLEISTSPQPTASSVIDSTRALVTMLREAMAEQGIELIARGVDPYNEINSVPLQLHRDRYTEMTRYFETLGPSGVRMMRQTAALQISVERGQDPRSRWLLLNAIAPIVVALFANSTNYAGERSDHVSYRAHLWRTLDDSRTGIPYDHADPASRYLEFALDAVAIRSGNEKSPYRTFREWMKGDDIGLDEWRFHLSTLFPEVRPKEYFELRSADTIEVEWLAAPLLFVTSLVYDPISAQNALDVVGLPHCELLVLAGTKGLRHPAVRGISRALADIALDGARRLGEDYISTRDVQTASEYFDRVLSDY